MEELVFLSGVFRIAAGYGNGGRTLTECVSSLWPLLKSDGYAWAVSRAYVRGWNL